MCRHGPCSLIRNGFLQYTTAEITLLALRIKACPAGLRLSLSLSSCSRSAVLGELRPQPTSNASPSCCPAHESLPGLMPHSGGQLGVAGRGQLSLQVLEHVEWEAADHSDG